MGPWFAHQVAQWAPVDRLGALVAALAIFSLLVALFKRRRQHQTFGRMQVPGPKPHLIHGHLYETRRQAYVSFANKMHERFGKTVGIYLGGDPFLITKDLELIQQVFVAKSRIFYDRMNFYLNVDPVPDNLICQRGERWRYMRRLLTPAFSGPKIRSSRFYRDAQQTVAKFIAQLESNSRPTITTEDQVATVARPKTTKTPNEEQASIVATQETLVEDLYDRMAAVALDVIIKTAFHMDEMVSFAGRLTSLGGQFGRGKPNTTTTAGPGSQTDKADHQLMLQQVRFLETVKRACRLGFNPLVEAIFCFPFLDGPLTFLCNHLYFSSILRLLYERLDWLVRRAGSASKQAVYKQSLKMTTALKAAALKQEVEDANNNNNNNCQEEGEEIKRCKAISPEKRKRIIDSLVEVLRERRITRSEFTGNALVIVFAGFETTANALTFSLWLLARHPAVQAKLRSEIHERVDSRPTKETGTAKPDTKSQETLGQHVSGANEDELTDEQLAELATGCDYLEMVVNEALRLYPPVPGLSCRQASVDCQLANGLRIEKGVNVCPSVFSIHRDTKIWGSDANEFRPERFATLDVNQLNSAMFMPFGLGPRNCIGKAAAIHELKIVVGLLVRRYQIAPWQGRTPDKVRLCSPINITITPADRIGLRFLRLK